jgi:hypothetical protein
MSTAFYRPLVYSDLVIAQLPAWEEVSIAAPPLEQTPPGPWRSLGSYLDYTDWPDRERFVELDRSIAAGSYGEGPMPRLRRCRAAGPGLDNCNTWFSIDQHYKGWKCEVHRRPVSGIHHTASLPYNLPVRADYGDGGKSIAERDGWLGEPARVGYSLPIPLSA